MNNNYLASGIASIIGVIAVVLVYGMVMLPASQQMQQSDLRAFVLLGDLTMVGGAGLSLICACICLYSGAWHIKQAVSGSRKKRGTLW